MKKAFIILSFILTGFILQAQNRSNSGFYQVTQKLAADEQQRLSNYLEKELNYPVAAIDSEVQALITASFATGKVGNVYEIIIESLSNVRPAEVDAEPILGILKAEVTRVLSNTPPSVFNTHSQQPRTIKQSFLFRLQGADVESYHPELPSNTVVIISSPSGDRRVKSGVKEELVSFNLNDAKDSVVVTQYRVNPENTPLYIVDGKEVKSIEHILPKNIESISILKGHKATGIYGSKAANGAIIIETKK